MKNAPAELYNPPMKYRMIENRKMFVLLLRGVSDIHEDRTVAHIGISLNTAATAKAEGRKNLYCTCRYKMGRPNI